MKTPQFSYINIWLFLCAFLILIITIIGGYTRLSGSGLSIVEWKPFIGTIPPLNHKEWVLEFAKYKISPEYIFKNYGMSLEEFKQIFLIEYIHRLVGRIAGIFFIIPLIYFICTKKISLKFCIQLLAIAALGILQAFIGWYMVRSGLKFHPYVSHYRLALHLGVAMIIYSSLIWLATSKSKQKYISKNLYQSLILLSILIFLQTIIGALVSGLKAGLLYNTFPLMDGKIFPEKLLRLPSNPFNNAVFIQFLHRVMGFTILAYTIYITIKYKLLTQTLYLLRVIPIIIVLQFFLGVITLLLISPWQLALLHQLVAVITITILVISIKSLTIK